MPIVAKNYVVFQRLYGVYLHKGSKGFTLRREVLQEGFVRMDEATLP